MTIFATKYGGGLLDGVPLLCTLYALSIFFEIFYLFIYFFFLWFQLKPWISDLPELTWCLINSFLWPGDI